MVGQTLRVMLPGIGRPLRLKVELSEALLPGIVSWSGRVLDADEGFFTITARGERLLGKILIGPASFVIRPSPALPGMHELIHIDRGLLPPDTDMTVDNTASGTQAADSPDDGLQSGGGASTQSTSGTSGSGDVQVLYLFANDVTNPSTLAANITSESNYALQRSGVSVLDVNKISVAGVKFVQDDFAGMCRSAILDEMKNRSGPFINLNQWMGGMHYNADTAFLIVRTDDNLNCGTINGVQVGRIGGAAHTFDQDKPFGLSTDTYALDDLTALHEQGHILGGQHANFTNTNPTVTGSGSGGAHGFENNNAGQWQTIMGGYNTTRCVLDPNELDPNMQTCGRIAYFSNPDINISINGRHVTIGANIDDGGVNNDDGQRKADMETWLENTGMSAVSATLPSARHTTRESTLISK